MSMSYVGGGPDMSHSTTVTSAPKSPSAARNSLVGTLTVTGDVLIDQDQNRFGDDKALSVMRVRGNLTTLPMIRRPRARRRGAPAAIQAAVPSRRRRTEPSAGRGPRFQSRREFAERGRPRGEGLLRESRRSVISHFRYEESSSGSASDGSSLDELEDLGRERAVASQQVFDPRDVKARVGRQVMASVPRVGHFSPPTKTTSRVRDPGTTRPTCAAARSTASSAITR